MNVRNREMKAGRKEKKRMYARIGKGKGKKRYLMKKIYRKK